MDAHHACLSTASGTLTNRMPRRESNPSISDALAPLETLVSADLYHHIFCFSPLNRPKPTSITTLQASGYSSPPFSTPATERTRGPSGWPRGAPHVPWHGIGRDALVRAGL